MNSVHTSRFSTARTPIQGASLRSLWVNASMAPTADLRFLLPAVAACLLCLPLWWPSTAHAAVSASGSGIQGAATGGSGGSGASEEGSSLEAAASKAGSTGRKVAMSLIGLAFAIAGIVLAFRRDFKEAAGVFAVGIVAVLLATPAGINLLQDTVNSLFGS
jgi:hypothetical protein